MASEAPRIDVFPSPNKPRQEYTVRDDATPRDILDEGFDNTVVITSEGADLYTAQQIGLDALRRKPKISTEKSLKEKIADASFRWHTLDQPSDTHHSGENS